MAFRGLAVRTFVLALLAVGLIAGCELKKASTGTPGGSGDSSKPTDSNPGDAGADTAAAKPSPSADKASETIAIEGSSTVYPICQSFAVEFEKKSHHKISVARNGTGSGYTKFLTRQADIWNASRPVDPKEADELKNKGIDWIELTIAIDGIVVAINPQNDWCTQLTCAQLKQIWEPDSKIETWKDLDPAWPAEKFQLYGADTASGTFEYFTEVINDKKKASNTKYTPASDDNILVKGIAANKYALGYIPFGYYIENTERLKVISVSPSKDASATPAPYVTPTEETILSGEYAPLSRPLFMYVNKQALLGRSEVADFMKFVLSDEAQPLIEKRKSVRVKDEVRQQMQQKLEAALAEKTASKN